MPRGGKRDGAGAKRGSKHKATLAKEAARERLRELLTDKLEPVAEALVSRACGVRYFVTRNKKTGKYELVTNAEQVIAALNGDDDESGEFYTDKPDTAAIKELFDRMVDKAKEQPQEVTLTGSVTLVNRLHAARARLAKRRQS